MTDNGDELPPRRPSGDDPLPEEAVPSEFVEEGTGLIRAEAVYFRQGPLPDAREVQRYDQALPGAADRIFKMTESEVAHRHGTERCGQFIGAGVAGFGLVGGFILILLGHDVAGVIFAGSCIVPIVYAFLRSGQRGGRREQADERTTT